MNERERIIRLWFDMWLQQRDLGIDEILPTMPNIWRVMALDMRGVRPYADGLRNGTNTAKC